MPNHPTCDPRSSISGPTPVRLVVFEGTTRNPSAIFNERAVLRLGRGLETTGPAERGRA